MANRSGKIALPFGNDTYVFKLGYGQLKELQDCVKAGPYYILESLFKNTWLVEYVCETIRCGLVGGGMSATDALRMVGTYVKDVESYPIATNIETAISILSAALFGAPEEDDGKKTEAAGGKTSRRSKKEKSASPQSTPPEP